MSGEVKREGDPGWLVEALETANHQAADVAANQADELIALRAQVSQLKADLYAARACLIDHLQYMKKPESAPVIQRIDATLNSIRKDG